MGKFCNGLARAATCFCYNPTGRVNDDDDDNAQAGLNPRNTASNSSNLVDGHLVSMPSQELSLSANIIDVVSPITHCHKSSVEWVSGARKETVYINWKVQDFPALCELKDLLRNETCVFSLGSTINLPTRWCFNLQKMKNESNIGLFLKRLKPLSFQEVMTGPPVEVPPRQIAPASAHQDVNNNDILAVALRMANNNNGNANNANPNPGAATDGPSMGDNEPVYVNYECVIKRAGYGDTWLHKRTCIPNFEIDQRLGFRKLFTLEEMNEADMQQPQNPAKPRVALLGIDNSLHLEIKFTIHLRTGGRTRSETDLLETLSLENAEHYHCKLLREQFMTLLKSGENADLILIMEVDDRTFPVHRGILAARSPVFSAMIHSGMKESRSGIVRIKDVTSKAMESILSYIYAGVPDADLRWNDVGEVQELIYAADKYSLEGLRDFCDKSMFTGCENDNATDLLYLAQTHGLNTAVKEISLYIKRNVNEIFKEN